MNEQRQQAYLNLIRSLLDSPSGEESEILAAKQELVDTGFVKTVEEVAQMCFQHGDEKTANCLQGFAVQLKEVLNLDTKVDLVSFSEEKIQTYYQFLMQNQKNSRYFGLICDRSFKSKPRHITQTQFRRKFLTNQYN